MLLRHPRYCFTTALTLVLSSGTALADSFELRDGDRVVFVGNTFIERDQVYGYLETMLTARWPDRDITFRNLGWSGDTVWGEARAGFDTPAEGFKRLAEQVSLAQPTVIIVGYGTNESFEGEPGINRFRDGLVRLLSELEKTRSRIFVFSPFPHADLGRSFPDPHDRNRILGLFAEVMREVSQSRGHKFLDFFRKNLKYVNKPSFVRRTDNGIHLNQLGYWWLAGEFQQAYSNMRGHSSQRVADCDGVSLDSFMDVQVSDFVRHESGYRFQVKYEHLPLIPAWDSKYTGFLPVRWFQVRGLPAGEYEIRVDGRRATELNLKPQRRAVQMLAVTNDPEIEQLEKLRQAIIAKNRLYFHRWRPQNETYLFGFRKHEQGQNAAELPKFDPLIEEMQAKIAKLREPMPHSYELILQKEGDDESR